MSCEGSNHKTAAGLARRWTDGYPHVVLQAISKMPGMRAAVVTSLMFNYLEQSEIKSFRRKLEREARKTTYDVLSVLR